ncbi:MAG: hypothetical protein RIG61_06575 [Deltaproteobacteria bacterium]
MSDYGVLYLIDTTYNGERDATEATLGYIEKEEKIKGRIRSIRVIVSVSGHKDDRRGASKEALSVVRDMLKRASTAGYEED